jgi:pyruvate dehydrogenase E2 component (dihydrolipoamide acetyltransferase)
LTGPRVTPLVRKLAAELGVDLADVTPSGPDGKLTRSDVQRAAARLSEPLVAGPAPLAAAAADLGLAGAEPSSRPMTAIRNAIARNMTASLQEMAQLTLGHEADVTSLVATRAALKAEYAASGRRTPTITDFVVKAAALALRAHPTMNSALRDGRIESPGRIDVGVAVAIEDGLLVPVVRNADRRTIADISADTSRLAAAGRAGKLSLPEMEGATFVVSSLGTAGIDFFTPIVNPGNAGILGVGRIRDGVRWEGETPKRTAVMTLSLTFDHRVIDGAPAANYLLAVAELLSRPLSLLAG